MAFQAWVFYIVYLSEHLFKLFCSCLAIYVGSINGRRFEIDESAFTAILMDYYDKLETITSNCIIVI